MSVIANYQFHMLFCKTLFCLLYRLLNTTGLHFESKSSIFILLGFIVSGFVNLQAGIFQEFVVREESVMFRINLSVLLDCLTIFGTNSLPGIVRVYVVLNDANLVLTIV